MQRVSNEYKKSMSSLLRERSFIMLSFGLINQEAQANSTVKDGDFSYYSNKENIFKNRDNIVYATLEKNFTKVDGSMLFLPEENESSVYYDTGIVSNKLISEAHFEIEINLNTIALDFKGLTIDFGDNFPTDFDIITNTNQKLEIRDNTQAEWKTEEVFNSVTSLKIIFYSMKYPENRVRIYNITFGYGLMYDNDSVLNSSFTSYVSPIGADVPQIDFSVKLKNYNHYFNIDNPDSAVNYLETGQEMDIMYGYQLPESNKIEWIQGGHLICSEWLSDDDSATIYCTDVFRSLDTDYSKGVYTSAGKSYYDLALDVLSVAKIKNYYIDPRLKMLYTTNPIPNVRCKEALQIIANACRCTLSQSRTGYVQIKSNFIPKSNISTNGETFFSNSENVLNNSEKVEYATLSCNYTPVNSQMYFLPKDGTLLNTGYISEYISDENCKFTTNPEITITQEAIKAYYGIELDFGNSLPSEFIIRTYNEDILVNEYPVTSEEIDSKTVILRDFDDFNVMKIEFTETKEPFNRIVLNYVNFSNVTNFTMTRNDMTSSPKAIKQELVKEILVSCSSYQKKADVDNLVNEEIEVTAGEMLTYYMQNACYDYSAKFNDSSDNIEIIDSGDYYVTVKFKITGKYDLNISGHHYEIVKKYAVKTLHTRGKTIKWENPLISDMNMANDLAEWLGDYYSSGIEYQYNTRGNPELDANDIVYQENEFIDEMKVNIIRHSIEFNQALSGSVTARRIGSG